MAKKKKWIQAASASIKKRGTEGVCTGPKFGGPTCPPGSKRYNLAKVFKGMAKKKKKAAWGSMIHAKDSAFISHQKAYDLAKAEKGEDRVTKADIAYQRTKHIKGKAGRHATGAMIHAKKSKYIQGTASTKDLLKNIDKTLGVLPGGARDWKAWKKPAKKATGAMIHAKKGYYSLTAGTTGESGIKELLKAIKAGQISGVIPHGARKHATGAMIHAKDSKYIRYKDDALGGTPDRPGRHPPVIHSAEKKQVKKKKKMTREEKIKIMTGPIPREFLHTPKRFLKSDPRMLRQGGILKAKTSAFAANPDAWKKARAASTTGMKVAGAGTAYTSPGWTTKINKSLNKLKGMMKLGTRTAATSGAINPSKWSKIPKPSQLKTLAKTGGRRSLLLMGGPMGAAAAAATLTPSLINKLTKRAPGATKTKLFGIDLKGAEKSARTREALMAKRNKARNAKTGTMVKANVGTEVLGKQSVPFESSGTTANLANERQGRKGAAVRGFNFKGVF